MRRKHRRVLEAIFDRPTRSGIKWEDVEVLLLACGAHIEERAGSRVYIELNGVAGHFHRPHPQKEIRKGAVDSLRKYLRNSGLEP